MHDSAYIDLGDAYISLAKVQNKVENMLKAMDAFCNYLKAIDAFNSVLSIKTIKPKYSFEYAFLFDEEYPLEYAEIQSNLGKAYIDLAKLKNKKENLLKANETIDKAIWCYKESLKTNEEYSIDYEKIHNYIDENYRLRKEICKLR